MPSMFEHERNREKSKIHFNGIYDVNTAELFAQVGIEFGVSVTVLAREGGSYIVPSRTVEKILPSRVIKRTYPPSFTHIVPTGKVNIKIRSNSPDLSDFWRRVAEIKQTLPPTETK